MKLFEIFGEIALKGDAKVSAGIDAVSKKAEGVVPKIENIGKAFDKSGRFMTSWVTGPIVAAGTAALALGVKIGNMADRILDLHAITGMSTKAIQQYQYATKIAGTDTEAVTQVMAKFGERLRQAETDTSPVAKALDALGISAQSLKTMSPDDQINTLISSLQKLPDPIVRARTGFELFGEQWTKLAPIVDLGSAALDKAKREGDKFAMNENQLNAANNFRISLERLKAEFGLVAQQLALALMPALEVFVQLARDHIVPAIQTLSEYLTSLAQWFAGLDPSVQAAIMGFVAFVAAIGPALIIIGKLITMGAATATALAGVGITVTGLLPILAALAAAIAAGIAIWRNWDAIVQEAQITWDVLVIMFDEAIDAVSRFGSEVTEIFSLLQTSVPAFVQTMSSAVLSAIDGMVDGAINSVSRMYTAIVGGSIIPDMVSDVGAEMAKMAKEGGQYANLFKRNVEYQLGDITPEPVKFGGISSTRAGASTPAGAGTSKVNVDMRWATFSDDRSIFERLARSGAAPTGAFV